MVLCQIVITNQHHVHNIYDAFIAIEHFHLLNIVTILIHVPMKLNKNHLFLNILPEELVPEQWGYYSLLQNGTYIMY